MGPAYVARGRDGRRPESLSESPAASGLEARERAATGEDRGVAELLLDAQQLVVLRDALAAGGRAGLDLARVDRDGEVGDGRVLGLRSGATASSGSRSGWPAIASSVSDSVPIWLTLTSSVRDTEVDALLQAHRVGHEQVVADELDLRADGIGEVLPGLPVVLGEGVLDRDDRVVGDEVGE
jgi:hypothetical protein